MAYIAMAYMIMAQAEQRWQVLAGVLYSHGLYCCGLHGYCVYTYSYGLHSYGLHSYGLYSYGLHSHGLHSYGLSRVALALLAKLTFTPSCYVTDRSDLDTCCRWTKSRGC